MSAEMVEREVVLWTAKPLDDGNGNFDLDHQFIVLCDDGAIQRSWLDCREYFVGGIVATPI